MTNIKYGITHPWQNSSLQDKVCRFFDFPMRDGEAASTKTNKKKMRAMELLRILLICS
jgi:hypothetical protein